VDRPTENLLPPLDYTDLRAEVRDPMAAMGLHRTVLEWTTDDYNTVVALARRMSDYVEANEPDTLSFEWFGR